MSNKIIKAEQEIVCKNNSAEYYPSLPNLKLGVSLNVKEGIFPINGLRHPPEGDTTGWYIWAGEEYSDDPDFFKPLHVEHIEEWCPEVQKYLGLPPGWRFLFTSDHEDVWYDETLLKI